MKRTTILCFIFILMSLQLSSQDRQAAKAHSKLRLTNVDLGISGNFLDGLVRKTFGVGLGVFVEPKFIDQNRNEFGVLFEYRNFDHLGSPEFHRAEDKTLSMIATVKKRTKGNFLGLYAGVGSGFIILRKGGIQHSDFGTDNSFHLNLGLLAEAGFYIDGFNLGIHFIGAPRLISDHNYKMLGLKFALRF